MRQFPWCLLLVACAAPELGETGLDTPTDEPTDEPTGETTEDCDASWWFADEDGDGFGDPTARITACEAPPQHVVNGWDCNDTDAEVFPGQLERCNGIDDDCNPSTVEEGVGWHALDSDEGEAWSDLTSDFRTGSESAPYAFTAPASGTLSLCDGVVHAAITSEEHALTILGRGASETALEGSGEHPGARTVDGTGELVLTGLTVRAGHGGVGWQGDLVVENVVIEGMDGQALAHRDGEAHLQDVVIQGNTCSVTCLHGRDGAWVLDDVRVEDNATTLGPAVVLVDTDATWTGGSLSRNVSEEGELGGGMFAHGTGTSVRLVDVGVEDNVARYGGGLHLADGATVTLSGARVAGNEAEGGAGAWLDSTEGTGTLLRCQPSAASRGAITSNTATFSGGGVVVLDHISVDASGTTQSESTLDLRDCDLGTERDRDDNAPEDVLHVVLTECASDASGCRDGTEEQTLDYGNAVTACIGPDCR